MSSRASASDSAEQPVEASNTMTQASNSAEEPAEQWTIWPSNEQVEVPKHEQTHTRPLPLPFTIDGSIRGSWQLADSAEQPVLAGSSTNSADVQNDLAADAGACLKSSSSAAQPVSKKRTLDIGPSSEASGSAAQPGTLLEQVKQLGRYPKRRKTPSTDKERAEDSLAKKISKQWSKLGDATKAELTRLQKETKGKGAEAQAERQAQDILERLHTSGKWPQEHHYSHASSPDIIAEARLAHDLRKCRRSGILSKAGVAEIDELHWIWLREQEAEATAHGASSSAVHPAARDAS